MQKLRRLNFFDRHVVKQEGADIHPGIQKLSVSCACGGPDHLWLGDRGGEVRCLDRQFALSAPLRAFDGELIDVQTAQDGQRLVALGCDAGPMGTTKYKVFEVRKDAEPVLLITNRVFQRAPERRATHFAVTSSLSMLAIGIDSGAIHFWRGRDLGDEKPGPDVIADEGEPPVTAVHFLEQGYRTVLFACNANSIRSWVVRERDDYTIRHLNTDPSGGASELCSCVFPTINALLVARLEAIFAYDADEGNMSAMPLEGEKMILTQFKSYFTSVTTEGVPNALASVSSSPSPSSMPKQSVTVCLAYPHMRFIAYSAQFTDVTHVVSALGAIFIFSRGGADGNTVLFELHEKPLSEQLDILVKKRMFEWAAEIAVKGGAAPETTADIYRRHGDALFEKRAYDQALAVYMKTVDLGLPLEPSYVVEQYLDAQRIAHVAKYLKKLHEKHLAESEHTALLLKCYTKLKDFSTLEEFLEKTPVSQYDPATAIDVLETAGYYGLAAAIAQKPEVQKHEDYIRISLEHFKSYAKAVDYLGELPRPEASRLLLEHGRVLMKNAPRETVGLIRGICGLKTTGEPWEEPSAAAGGAGASAPAPPCGDLPQLELFLRSILLGPGACPLPAPEAERLFPTLLELMVRSYCQGEEAPAAPGRTTSGEGGASSSEEDPARRRLHGEIMRLIRQHPSEEALASTLMLSQTYGFVDGFFHAAEKLGRFQLLMNWCFERRDARRLMEVCKRSGQIDQSLWVQALSFLATDEGDHMEEIGEVLRHVETSDLMPLLMVIDTLQKSKGITVGAVRPYLQGQFRKLVESVETSRGKAHQDRQEIARMQQEITDLRTRAQVFQNNKCFQCGLPLEVPAVHFFCGHSYHSYCLPDDGGCPKCSSEALPKMTLLGQREAQARNAEDFFKYLQGSSGDKQIQAVSEWCKFGAFDASARHGPAGHDEPGM